MRMGRHREAEPSAVPFREPLLSFDILPVLYSEFETIYLSSLVCLFYLLFYHLPSCAVPFLVSFCPLRASFLISLIVTVFSSFFLPCFPSNFVSCFKPFLVPI